MSEASSPKHEPLAADLSGRQLGDYRLLRRLGRGAMAEVYLAEQCSLGRQVAIKVLKPELATDQTYIRRFLREAQAAAALVHANIVQIHEIGHIDDVHFIAQEYVQGLNLRQWITRNGALDLRMALIVMRQVASALAKAADQGIVHRDIKPENIMLTRSGEVKVADFGLARLPTKGEAVELTQTGMTLGTPLYMSPEQVEGNPLDPRSDIYSFGVTCYQMLVGSPPFDGETALSVAVQHLKKSPESLENQRPDLPPALGRIVHKMLAKAPEDRHQSARELLKELRPIQLEHLDDEWPEDLPGWDLAELDTAAASLAETTQRLDALMKTGRGGPSGRFVWLSWTAGLALAFLFGGGLAFFVTREEPLLAHAEAQLPSVPIQDTAASQWVYAMHVDSEEGWQAVIDHFADEANWANRAKRQQAWLYVQHDDYDRAMQRFEELALLDGSQRELRASGLVGQYWVLNRQGDADEAAAVLSELISVLDELRDPRTGRLRLRDPLTLEMLQHARKNSPGASSSQQRQLREWLDRLDQEPAEAD
jgi:serine/threonine-protein kinase